MRAKNARGHRQGKFGPPGREASRRGCGRPPKAEGGFDHPQQTAGAGDQCACLRLRTIRRWGIGQAVRIKAKDYFHSIPRFWILRGGAHIVFIPERPMTRCGLLSVDIMRRVRLRRVLNPLHWNTEILS